MINVKKRFIDKLNLPMLCTVQKKCTFLYKKYVNLFLMFIKKN